MRGVLLPAVKQALEPPQDRAASDGYRRNHGRGAPRKRLRGGPKPHRQDLALDAGDLHRVLRRNPQAIRPGSRSPACAATPPRRFSFNNEGGRCDTCGGQGVIKIEMNFLPASYIPCGDCHGKRYNAATLEVLYNGNSIGDVMDLTFEEAAEFFHANPEIHRPLALLVETGLGYLKLGQPSPTLSGGEAQRLKLVTELTRGLGVAETTRIRRQRTPKSTLYLLEEPTIGLHMADVQRLAEGPPPPRGRRQHRRRHRAQPQPHCGRRLRHRHRPRGRRRRRPRRCRRHPRARRQVQDQPHRPVPPGCSHRRISLTPRKG